MAIRLPKTTVNILPAYEQPLNAAQKILFIGQKTAAGSATAGTLYETIENDNQWDDLFGKHSILSAMIRNFKKINKINKVDAIPLDDAGGSAAAAGQIVFSGTATENGELTLIVGSEVNHSYTITVENTHTALTVADAFSAAITADNFSPVTATDTTGTLDITAANKGTEGNFITLRLIGSVAGITVSTFTAMATGAGDPVLTGVTTLIENIRYQTIVMPSVYAVSTISNFLDSRFNVDNDVLDGILHIGKTDTKANLVTYGNTFDSQCLNIIGNIKVSDATNYYVGSALRELDYVIASEFAAIRSLRLTENVSIAQYIISSEGLDSYGGMHIASLPYFNTPFIYLPIVDKKHDLQQDDLDDLTTAGITIIGNNSKDTRIIAGEVVTTYKTDAAGNDDDSYKYEEYVDTISNIREYMFDGARGRWRQSRLTDGEIVPRMSFANAEMIKAHFVQMYNELGFEGLTRLGESNLKIFKDNIDVTLDLELGKATIIMLVPIVTQLRIINASIQISF